MGKKQDSTRPYKTAIVLPDLHVPRHDEVTLAAVERYIADCWWDYYVNLGDFMDFNCISSYNDEYIRRKAGETVQADYVVGNEVLDRHCKAARRKNPACEMVLLEGNHDERMERYIDRNPELEGIMEPEKMLGLKERGIKWRRSHRLGEGYKIGRAEFQHGMYLNVHHAKKTALSFGEPIFYGHTHDIQAHSEILRGNNKTVMAQSLGCLCEYEQGYMRGRPNRWQQAFGVFHFWPDGYFQPTVVPIFKHRFVGPTNGKVYDGRR